MATNFDYFRLRQYHRRILKLHSRSWKRQPMITRLSLMKRLEFVPIARRQCKKAKVIENLGYLFITVLMRKLFASL